MNRNNESDQLNEKEGMNSAWAWACIGDERADRNHTQSILLMSHQHHNDFFAFTETAKFRNRTMCKKSNHHTNAELITVWKSTFCSWDARGRHHMDNCKKPSCAVFNLAADFKNMYIYSDSIKFKVAKWIPLRS